MTKIVLPKHLTDIKSIELIHGRVEDGLDADDLRVYQNWMVDKITELPGVYLAAEMGLGKTGAVLKAMADLKAAGEIKSVLIVAPSGSQKRRGLPRYRSGSSPARSPTGSSRETRQSAERR